MEFEFSTSDRIIFGNGTVERVGRLARDMGHRVFVVTGKTKARAVPVTRQLDQENIVFTVFNVSDEPTIAEAESAAGMARDFGGDLVIGIGGGSVMDTAKVIAAMLSNEGDLLDYLEIVGKGIPISKAPAPCIAIPTTAGTGSEVTRNAVLIVEDRQIKVSLRSPLLLPDIALVDPLLTRSMPPSVTAATGLDVITQLLEAFLCQTANPLTDGLCREGLVRAARSLHAAYTDGSRLDAREDMALASLFGGIALANSGLGAVHGIAAPLGGLIKAPHGAVCGRLLPIVLDANIRALESRTPQSPALKKINQLPTLMDSTLGSSSAELMVWVRDLCRSLNIPPLSSYGFRSDDIPTIVEAAKGASSMRGNPIALFDDELSAILEEAL